jgi:hypothetical protein
VHGAGDLANILPCQRHDEIYALSTAKKTDIGSLRNPFLDLLWEKAIELSRLVFLFHVAKCIQNSQR